MKRLFNGFIFFLFVSLSFETRAAETLSLKAYEAKALAVSAKLKSTREEVSAVTAQKDSVSSTYWPKLSIEGSYRHLSEVPEITLGPITRKLGDETNYSIGPQLSWQIFDRGRDMTHESLKAAVQAKQAEIKNSDAQFLLAVRAQYAQTQLAMQELQLTEQALKLSENQFNDIVKKLRAGASSQLDKANAERDVSTFRIRQKQALAALESSVIDLFALISEQPPALASVQLSSFEEIQNELGPDPVPPTGFSHHPAIQALAFTQSSLQYGARSQNGTYWPSIQLFAKTSLDYPNGPELEEIHQNTLGANLSWTLFDGGRGSDLKSQKLAEFRSAGFRKEQLEQDLNRDYKKAQIQLNSLIEQLKEAELNVKQSQKVVNLFGSSYRAGRLNLLDVQAVNLKLLDASVLKARLQAQLIIQKAYIKALTSSEGENEK